LQLFYVRLFFLVLFTGRREPLRDAAPAQLKVKNPLPETGLQAARHDVAADRSRATRDVDAAVVFPPVRFAVNKQSSLAINPIL
jgi:hypothetical protein